MTTPKQIRNAGAAALENTEKALNTANKAAAEMVAEKVKTTASSTQSHTIDFVESMRGAILAGSESLRKDGYTTAANLIDNTAGRIDQVETQVEGINPAKVSHSVQGFIREKPLIAFGGLALAGFIAAAAMQKAHDDIDDQG